jgi:hypothetical protein
MNLKISAKDNKFFGTQKYCLVKFEINNKALKKRTPQYKSRFSLDFERKTAFILRGPIF